MKKIILLATLFLSATAFAQRAKDSTLLKNGGYCIFLDFDGQTVPAGTAWNVRIVAAASSINGNAASMDSVVNYVSEFYTPFQVVVTRDSTLYFFAPVGKRIRVIFSPTCSIYSCIAGATASIGQLGSGDETPSFVNDNIVNTLRLRGRAAAHEAGHQLGLDHQNSAGGGSGETGWRPLMNGTISGGLNMETFALGTNTSSTTQDDVSWIAYGYSLFHYPAIGARQGDAGNTFNTAKYLQKDQSFYAFIGVQDSDYYRIDIPSTQTITISVTPWSNGSSNANSTLDAAIDLYNSTGTLVSSSSNATTLNASLTQALLAGTYRIKVRSDRGNANNPTGYGFMGHYTISFTY